MNLQENKWFSFWNYKYSALTTNKLWYDPDPSVQYIFMSFYIFMSMLSNQSRLPNISSYVSKSCLRSRAPFKMERLGRSPSINQDIKVRIGIWFIGQVGYSTETTVSAYSLTEFSNLLLSKNWVCCKGFFASQRELPIWSPRRRQCKWRKPPFGWKGMKIYKRDSKTLRGGQLSQQFGTSFKRQKAQQHQKAWEITEDHCNGWSQNLSLVEEKTLHCKSQEYSRKGQHFQNLRDTFLNVKTRCELLATFKKTQLYSSHIQLNGTKLFKWHFTVYMDNNPKLTPSNSRLFEDKEIQYSFMSKSVTWSQITISNTKLKAERFANKQPLKAWKSISRKETNNLVMSMDSRHQTIPKKYVTLSKYFWAPENEGTLLCPL